MRCDLLPLEKLLPGGLIALQPAKAPIDLVAVELGAPEPRGMEPESRSRLWSRRGAQRTRGKRSSLIVVAETNREDHLARAGGRALTLSVREQRLLTELARRADRVVSREELFRLVWAREMRRGDRSVADPDAGRRPVFVEHGIVQRQMVSFAEPREEEVDVGRLRPRRHEKQHGPLRGNGGQRLLPDVKFECP